MIAVLVVAQSIELSDSYALLTQTSLWLLQPVVMIALFALAGFCVTRGFARAGIRTVLSGMFWHFWFALLIVVVATALVGGAFIANERPALYYADHDTWLYLLNVVGVTRMTLPGVFEFNSLASTVNGNLWLVPAGYASIAITAFVALRPQRQPNLLLYVCAGAIGLAIVIQTALADIVEISRFSGILTGKGLNSVVGFLAGAIVYHKRSRVFVDRRIAAMVAVGVLLVALAGDRNSLDSAIVGPATALGVAYLTLFVGGLPLPFRHALPRYEHLLWRTLLWSFPISQFWFWAGPDRQPAALNLMLSAPTVILLAAAQWRYVEARILRRLFGEQGPQLVADESANLPNRAIRKRSLFMIFRAALPQLMMALLVILLTLGAIAIAVFALQRESVGV